MARKKIEFMEDVNFRIAQLVEVNKSVREIQEDLLKTMNFKVGEETLRRKIKELGLDKKDSRTSNVVSFNNVVEFNDNQKIYIKIMYEGGMSLNEIREGLKKEYNIEVASSTINKLIKGEGYKKDKRFEFVFDDEESEPKENNLLKDLRTKEKKGGNKTPISERIPNFKESLKKMVNDKNFIRFCWYLEDKPYNYDGEGKRKGAKDTWFSRDGFLKINVSQHVYMNEQGYELIGGQYRSAYELNNDMDFYTFKIGYDGRGKAVLAKRNEIKEWYNKNRKEINRLYDVIVENNYATWIEEIQQFNKLCKELYNKKVELAVILGGSNSNVVKCLSGERGELTFNSVQNYMKELGIKGDSVTD